MALSVVGSQLPILYSISSVRPPNRQLFKQKLAGYLFQYCYEMLTMPLLVSYTLAMHIGSLWGLIFFFSPSKVNVTKGCDLSNRSYHRLEYDDDKNCHFGADLDKWGQGQALKCQKWFLIHWVCT